MNFAYGGTGVFNTLVDQPNMTAQINFFQQLVQENVYTRNNLSSSSIVLVSLSGNDYGTYFAKNSSLKVSGSTNHKVRLHKNTHARTHYFF